MAFFDSLRTFIYGWNCSNFIILGDFNVVLSSEERLGSNGFAAASEELVDFVDRLGCRICR